MIEKEEVPQFRDNIYCSAVVYICCQLNCYFVFFLCPCSRTASFSRVSSPAT